MNTSSEAVRGLVRSRVEFAPVLIDEVFGICIRQCTQILDWLRVVKRQSNVN